MTTAPTQARTLLLTFFGPFPGVPVNSTVALAEGAQRLLTRMRPDLNVITRELPVSYEGQRISRELGLSIPAGFVHVPATCADGEEATEDTGMTAHRDAGGVVRDEQGIPQLPESTVVRIIAEVASDTLPAVN